MSRKRLTRPNYKLYSRAGTWYIRWTENQVTRRVSTGQTIRVEAEKWRDQWIAGRSQLIIPSQATIAEIMQAYITARLPNVQSKETLLLCARTITRLIGNLEPRMLDRSSYSNARLTNVTAGSVRREIVVLRAALNWAKRDKWIDEIPYVEMPPKPPPRDRWKAKSSAGRFLDSPGLWIRRPAP